MVIDSIYANTNLDSVQTRWREPNSMVSEPYLMSALERTLRLRSRRTKEQRKEDTRYWSAILFDLERPENLFGDW